MTVLGSGGTVLPPRVAAVVVAYVVGGALGVGLSWYAFRRREEPTARSFGVLTVLATVICLGLAGRLLAWTLPAKHLWTTLTYVGWVSIGPAILVFALRFVGMRQWVTRRSVLALAALPAVTFSLVAIAPYAGLGLHYTSLVVTTVDGWPVAAFEVGPWFWVHALYEYALVLFGVTLLVRHSLGAIEPFRTQGFVLGGSFLFMTAVNVVYLQLGVRPFPGADLTPLGIVVGLCVVAVAIFRVRLVDVVPVARDRVFRALDDAVVVVDAQGRVVDLNASGSDLLPGDAVGRPASAALPDPAVERGLLGDSVDEAELTLTVGGQERWFLVRRQWVDDRAFALIFTDVTERREREERLEEFASVVSHDLRNPLSVARAHVELADEADEPESHLERADSALDRIDHIVDELLTLARQGEPVVDPAPVSIERVSTDAWDMVRSPDASLTVEGDRTVQGEYDRLRRLFENLFRNAVDHAGESVQVTVRVTESGFEVADDGPGIPESDRSDVFERGFSTGSEGTGLGLAIVDGVASAHDWAVEVGESDAGGVCFRFETAP